MRQRDDSDRRSRRCSRSRAEMSTHCQFDNTMCVPMVRLAPRRTRRQRAGSFSFFLSSPRACVSSPVVNMNAPITEIFAERYRRRRSRCSCCCVGNAVVPASAATRVCAADKNHTRALRARAVAKSAPARRFRSTLNGGEDRRDHRPESRAHYVDVTMCVSMEERCARTAARVRRG